MMAMKEWLTADEIAREALTALPNTKRGVNALILREQWNDHPSFARIRSGREGGGGLEYHIQILPLLAQVAYKQKHITIADHSKALVDYANDEVAAPVKLSARARSERDARLAIVQAYEMFAKGVSTINQTSRVQLFTDRYAMGYLQIDAWVKEIIPSFSKRSLIRWIGLAKKGQSNDLAVDRSQSRSGKGLLHTANNGDVRRFILAMMASAPHLSAHHVRTMCRDEFGDEIYDAQGNLKPVPPVRTFQHVLKGYKEVLKVQLTKLRNPDLYRSTMLPAGVGSLRHVTAPNKLWQIDASPVDALCVEGRQNIYACIDIATRRTILFVSQTPRASAVALLIRKAILAWGLPETIKTDNGSDFVAHDTRRLFSSIGVEMELSDAYSPQQKGHVERVIKTFQHDFVALLPGYVGHSVADRKEIENRKSFSKRLGETEAETFGVSLTGPDLQKLCDRWAEEYYQHKPHAGLKGKTPFQVATASSASIKTVDEQALDLLLMPVAGTNGYRTVTKTGIRIDHHHYMTRNILPGERVFVRQDPNDVGRVYAFEEDGGVFLGEAICAELAGVHPATLAKATREMHAEIIDETNAQIKRDMRVIAKGRSLIERALEVASRDMPNVVALPKRQIEHTTPQIEAALEVVRDAGAKLSDVPVDEKTAAEQKRLIEAMAADEAEQINDRFEIVTEARAQELETQRTAHLPTNVIALPETPKQRYVRALEVKRHVDDGTVNPVDAVWFGQYQTTPEFIAQSRMHEDFGDGYLEL